MNRYSTTTVLAAADYNAGGQYHAFALVDGQLANSIGEASGILVNKPKSGEHAAIAYEGELKYAAGGAISKGDKLTIVTSGWFTSANSDEAIVGIAKADVSSGGIETGLFNFPGVRGNLDHVRFNITPLVDMIAGTVIAFNDYTAADSGGEADAVALTSMTSGTAADVAVLGVVQGKMDASQCSSKGDALTVTTSGYFIKATSGLRTVAKTLTNINSDSLGDILFLGSIAGNVP